MRFFCGLSLALVLGCRTVDPKEPNGQENSQEAIVDGAREAEELDRALAACSQVVWLEETRARAPKPEEEAAWPAFLACNRSRWDLELDAAQIPSNTAYGRISSTEEGGIVREFLTFAQGNITWWFDGRGDDFSEFENPSLRRERVVALFLAEFDGKMSWKASEARAQMPLDRGLALGIRLADGSERFW